MKGMSYDDYLRLVGLLTLAADHRKSMEAIERSAMALVGETETGGHVGDAVWGNAHDAASLVCVLGITVDPTPLAEQKASGA